MNFFQRRKILKQTNSLDLIPVRLHEHETEENGLITLLVPRFKNKFLSRYLVPKNKSRYFKIKLDEIGSLAWKSMDGQKSIREICDILSQELGDKVQPVEERLSKFCFMLYEQRYITFTVLQD